MKILMISILLFALDSLSAEHSSCDVVKSSTVPLFENNKNTIMSASIKGTPCYEAELIIKISHSQTVIYSYRAPFKPHIAIQSSNVNEIVAQSFVESLFEDYNFLDCSKILPSKLTTNDVWNYNKLLIEENEYNRLKESGCRAFTHKIHYEINRVVVFPDKSTKGIPSSEYGL